MSSACLTSSGLSGVVSRAMGLVSTVGNGPAGDGEDDEEHPDASAPAARQIAIAASPLADTQLRPRMWAYPRYAFATLRLADSRATTSLAFPLWRYNVYQSKNYQALQALRKERANKRLTL